MQEANLYDADRAAPTQWLLLCFGFNVPPTAKVIWRRGHSLKSHPTDWKSRESNPRPLVYKASGLSTTPRRLLRPSGGHAGHTGGRLGLAKAQIIFKLHADRANREGGIVMSTGQGQCFNTDLSGCGGSHPLRFTCFSLPNNYFHHAHIGISL